MADSQYCQHFVEKSCGGNGYADIAYCQPKPVGKSCEHGTITYDTKEKCTDDATYYNERVHKRCPVLQPLNTWP